MEAKHGNYKDLQVWQLAQTLSVKVHRMTMSELPKFEMYETGSQSRRSAKSVRSNIVEGYGRRRFKQGYIKHLIYAHASCDETVDHLETLWECGSLTNENLFKELLGELNLLGGKMNRFIEAVELKHQSPK